MAVGVTVGASGLARSTAREAPLAATLGNRISFADMVVAYGDLVVVHPLDLTIEPGEFLALIGPSGSGKTTVLRALAGFVKPARGRISIGDADITDVPPYARGIGMVVQNYALFPHMRVEDNVAFGLLAQKAPKHLIAERVRDSLCTVGMSAFGHRYPRELSGGQQQRVAIARALAIRPRVLLLDEPLSALDAQIRRNMVDELASLHHNLPGLTTLYVTHDQTEALTLGDRIAIMRDGRLTAHGPASDLYRTPPNRFTAEFLGRANLLPVRIIERGGHGEAASVRLGPATLRATGNAALGGSAECLLCVRPHDLVLQAGPEHANCLMATVAAVQWQGDQHAIAVEAGGHEVRLVVTPMRRPPELGSSIEVFFSPDDATLVPLDAGHG